MTHIQQRRDQAAVWTSINPVLFDGEMGHEKDTGRSKLGDGVTPWNDLPYMSGVDSVNGEVGHVSGFAKLDSPHFTGFPTAPTPSAADNDTSIATTAYVKSQGYATLASPTFTGDPKAPTPAAGDADTSIANTQFVSSAVSGLRTELTTVINDLPDSPWVYPETFGAKGDGVTDDTVAINNALAAGSVLFGAKRYKINGAVLFPANTTQQGLGSGSTVFVLGSSGVIRVGDPVIVPSKQAGKTAGFTIEGNNTTSLGMQVDCVGRGRQFEDIFVRGCQYGIWLRGSQNTTWKGVDVQGGLYGVLLDNGAGGNVFHALQTLDQAISGLFIRSGGNPAFNIAGTYYPANIGASDNHFIGCRFEIPRPGAESAVKINCGLRNMFKSCLISGQNLSAGRNAVHLFPAGGASPRYTVFEDCNIQGDGVADAGIFATGTGAYTIVRGCVITGFSVMLKVGASDYFWREGLHPLNFTDAAQIGASASGVFATVAQRGPDPSLWVPLTPGTGWYATAADAPQFRRVGGRIEFRGALRSVASGSVSGTCGTNIFPAADRVYTFPNRSGGNGQDFNVQIAGSTLKTNAIGNGFFLSLDGIGFDTDL